MPEPASDDLSLAPTQNDNSLKSSQSNSMISVTEERKHKTQATKLRFLKIHGRPDVARVQLLLSNISDRALYFKLKSNVGSNVSALPSGSGHVASRGSARCVLTWHRPKNVAEWNDVEQPKLLLVTRFLDSNNEMTNDQTSTRLIARVSSKGSCSANNPPVEQFLLDAVSKTQDEGAVVSIQRQPQEEKAKNAFNEFINGLSPEQLNALLLLLMVFFFVLYNSCTGSSNDRRR